MEKYLKERIKEEHERVSSIFLNLESRWENLGEHQEWFEDLYRIQVHLIPFAAIVRKAVGYSNKKYFVTVLSKTSTDVADDTSKYLYSEDWKRIGRPESKELGEVCSAILHSQESVFGDSRLSDGKMRPDTRIYYFVATDRMCQACKSYNSVENKLYRPRGAFTWPNNCTCGYDIDLKDLLTVTKEFYQVG